MNLLQRSINAQNAHSSASTTVKKSTFNTNSTNTHVLFHLNDPYASYEAPPSQFFAGGGHGGGLGGGARGKSSKSSSSAKNNNSNNNNIGFMESANSGNSSSASPNFDYYEYFSNYGRILASPPTSPASLDNSFSDTQSPQPSGFKRFWRRNSPARHPQISLNNEMSDKLYSDRSGYDSYAMRGNASPRIQRQSSSNKSAYRFSLPNSPGPRGYNDGLGPLMASSHDSYGPFHGFNDSPCRISFVETNLYVPIDLPQSPENMPPRPYRHHQFLHQEWVAHTVDRLKSQFKSTSILINVERKARYPFIVYGSPGPAFDLNAEAIVPTAACNTLSPELRMFDGLYDVCASITRPGSNFDDEDHIKPIGYIVCAFQTFPGEDSEKLERNWLVWTGK